MPSTLPATGDQWTMERTKNTSFPVILRRNGNICAVGVEEGAVVAMAAAFFPAVKDWWNKRL